MRLLPLMAVLVAVATMAVSHESFANRSNRCKAAMSGEPDKRSKSGFIDIPKLKGVDLPIGSRIFYRSFEAEPGKPTLVMWHGNASESVQLSMIAAFAAAEGLGVISLDLPGHGETLLANLKDGSVDESTSYSLPFSVAASSYALQKIGAKNLVLFGHSYGALVAAMAASEGGVRSLGVKGLILLDPPVSYRSIEDYYVAVGSAQYAPMKFWSDMFLPGYFDSLARSNVQAAAMQRLAPGLQQMILENARAFQLPSDEATVQAKLTGALSTYYSWMGMGVDLTGLYPKSKDGRADVDMPVHLYRAGRSVVFPEAIARGLEYDWNVAGVETDLTTIPDADHKWIVMDPGFVGRLLAKVEEMTKQRR